jgi:hypothetical protein
VNQSLIATLAFLVGVVVVLADGRSAVPLAAFLAGLVLAPAAGSVGGTPAALVPLVLGSAALVTSRAARTAAERLPAVPGLDPEVPVVAPLGGLFGPRSIRLVAGTLALPAASWVSLNVSVGGAAVASGAVFAVAYLWLIGMVRLMRARALDELAVGAAVVALSAATGWLLEAGPGATPEAAAVAGLAPAAAGVAGWLTGRHRRRSVVAP